jgi:hypothetical protein
MTEAKAEQMLSAKDVAAKLKLDPKRFRALLRKINGKSNKGARYEWKASDPLLQKLPQLIKAQEEKENGSKEEVKQYRPQSV